jgi:ComF family protein
MATSKVYSRFDRWIGCLLPPRCVLCHRLGEDRGFDLCLHCQRDLPWIEQACGRCGLPVTAGEYAAPPAPGDFAPGCAQCRDRKLPYRRCFAPCGYEFPLARLIQALKYEGALAHGRVLGTLLARAASRLGGPCAGDRRSIDAVVPMPLHVDRLVERGYNQSWEIARFTAAELGLPCLPQSLRRVRGTRPQVGLPREQRLANVRGAFQALPRDVAGRRIVLLDDVVTTGSTVAAAAQSLVDAGARSVDVWCVARASG